MKRILTQCAVAGVLLLGAPVAAGAASLQQAGEAGAAQYLPIIVVGIVLALLVARQVFMRRDKPAPWAWRAAQLRRLPAEQCAGNCGLPFARNVLDLNMLMGKLVRCPHCGKWAVLPAASPEELAACRGPGAPDARRRDPAAEPARLSSEEQLRRRIEDSRYE